MKTSEIFNKINELLEDTEYPYEISDITELEEFLNNGENSRFKAYHKIEQLYEDLIMELDPENLEIW